MAIYVDHYRRNVAEAGEHHGLPIPAANLVKDGDRHQSGVVEVHETAERSRTRVGQSLHHYGSVVYP